MPETKLYFLVLLYFSFIYLFLELPLHHYTTFSLHLTNIEAGENLACDIFPSPRERFYVCVGCCLLFKEFVVCSHLSCDLLKIVVSICNLHGFIDTNNYSNLKQLLFWKEIFIKEKEEDRRGGRGGEGEGGSRVQWFLLVVGEGKSLLCTLLQSFDVVDDDKNIVGPHPYYVEETLATLRSLCNDNNMEEIFEKCLMTTTMPLKHLSTQNNNNDNNYNYNNNNSMTQTSSQGPRGRKAKESKLNSIYRSKDVDFHCMDHTSRGSIKNVGWRGSRSSIKDVGRGCLEFCSNRLTSVPRWGVNEVYSKTTGGNMYLTKGPHNTLLHYLTLQTYSTILIGPPPGLRDMDRVVKSIERHIIEAHNILSCGGCGGCGCCDGCGGCDGDVLEYGVMLQFARLQLKYWLVGRKWNNEEVYLCFEEGVPQNIVEMVFKLRFGSF